MAKHQEKTELIPNEPKVEVTVAPSAPPLPPAPPPVPLQGLEAEKDAAWHKLQSQRTELQAMQDELELLEMQNAKRILQDKIDFLKNGGLTPDAVKRRDDALAKREATVKETQEGGKVLALYELTEKGYKGLFPGDFPAIREAGTIIKLGLDRLPGPSLAAISPEAPKPEAKFRRV